MTGYNNKSNGSFYKRRVKKLSRKYLENVAVWYLQRFSCSEASLRKVLKNRIDRAAKTQEFDKAEAQGWMDEIVAKFMSSGILNDKIFAETKVSAMRLRGDSANAIRQKLLFKGVSEEHIKSALEKIAAEQQGDIELQAALKFAKRKRLGPHRLPELRREFYKKDLAAFGRAGFAYETARKILTTEDVDELAREASGE